MEYVEVDGEVCGHIQHKPNRGVHITNKTRFLNKRWNTINQSNIPIRIRHRLPSTLQQCRRSPRATNFIGTRRRRKRGWRGCRDGRTHTTVRSLRLRHVARRRLHGSRGGLTLERRVTRHLRRRRYSHWNWHGRSRVWIVRSGTRVISCCCCRSGCAGLVGVCVGRRVISVGVIVGGEWGR